VLARISTTRLDNASDIASAGMYAWPFQLQPKLQRPATAFLHGKATSKHNTHKTPSNMSDILIVLHSRMA